MCPPLPTLRPAPCPLAATHRADVVALQVEGQRRQVHRAAVGLAGVLFEDAGPRPAPPLAIWPHAVGVGGGGGVRGGGCACRGAVRAAVHPQRRQRGQHQLPTHAAAGHLLQGGLLVARRLHGVLLCQRHAALLARAHRRQVEHGQGAGAVGSKHVARRQRWHGRLLLVVLLRLMLHHYVLLHAVLLLERVGQRRRSAERGGAAAAAVFNRRRWRGRQEQVESELAIPKEVCGRLETICAERRRCKAVGAWPAQPCASKVRCLFRRARGSPTRPDRSAHLHAASVGRL